LRVRFPVISLGLGAVFLAALAGANLRAPAGQAVDWRVVPDEEPEQGALVELEELRRQLDEIEEALPAARSRALADLQVPSAVELCGQIVPLDRPEVREALAYELLLAVGRPLMPMLWERRAPSLLPQIETRLAAADLPDDIKYLAMVESDLRLTVRSPAGAVGLWQFMRDTGRRYGLRVDRYIDERMDPDLSTDAAVAYLKDLHDRFGDWFVAFAAYNAGETRVQNALDEQSPPSYFDMYLPYETRRYVHRIVVAKLLHENPATYGLATMSPLHVPHYKTVEVQVRPARADLRVLAREHGLGYASLRLANPKLLGPWLPRGTHRLRVPDDVPPAS